MKTERIFAKTFQEIPVGMALFDSNLRRVATLWYNESRQTQGSCFHPSGISGASRIRKERE